MRVLFIHGVQQLDGAEAELVVSVNLDPDRLNYSDIRARTLYVEVIVGSVRWRNSVKV